MAADEVPLDDRIGQPEESCWSNHNADWWPDDQRLRKHKWCIISRENGKEPLWGRRQDPLTGEWGEVANQAHALRLCDKEDEPIEAEVVEAEKQLKVGKPETCCGGDDNLCHA